MPLIIKSKQDSGAVLYIKPVVNDRGQLTDDSMAIYVTNHPTIVRKGEKVQDIMTGEVFTMNSVFNSQEAYLLEDKQTALDMKKQVLTSVAQNHIQNQLDGVDDRELAQEMCNHYDQLKNKLTAFVTRGKAIAPIIQNFLETHCKRSDPYYSGYPDLLHSLEIKKMSEYCQIIAPVREQPPIYNFLEENDPQREFKCQYQSELYSTKIYLSLIELLAGHSSSSGFSLSDELKGGQSPSAGFCLNNLQELPKELIDFYVHRKFKIAHDWILKRKFKLHGGGKQVEWAQQTFEISWRRMPKLGKLVHKNNVPEAAHNIYSELQDQWNGYHLLTLAIYQQVCESIYRQIGDKICDTKPPTLIERILGRSQRDPDTIKFYSQLFKLFLHVEIAGAETIKKAIEIREANESVTELLISLSFFPKNCTSVVTEYVSGDLLPPPIPIEEQIASLTPGK